mmetsp:Transcript_23671/g.51742  ORF Transcript_23671/g.51742 Transcript_23671/m.51742 type:complete len:239 (+) Transcript_23671:1244-1960(+)
MKAADGDHTLWRPEARRSNQSIRTQSRPGGHNWCRRRTRMSNLDMECGKRDGLVVQRSWWRCARCTRPWDWFSTATATVVVVAAGKETVAEMAMVLAVGAAVGAALAMASVEAAVLPAAKTVAEVEKVAAEVEVVVAKMAIVEDFASVARKLAATVQPSCSMKCSLRWAPNASVFHTVACSECRNQSMQTHIQCICYQPRTLNDKQALSSPKSALRWLDCLIVLDSHQTCLQLRPTGA